MIRIAQKRTPVGATTEGSPSLYDEVNIWGVNCFRLLKKLLMFFMTQHIMTLQIRFLSSGELLPISGGF